MRMLGPPLKLVLLVLLAPAAALRVSLSRRQLGGLFVSAARSGGLLVSTSALMPVAAMVSPLAAAPAAAPAATPAPLAVAAAATPPPLAVAADATPTPLAVAAAAALRPEPTAAPAGPTGVSTTPILSLATDARVARDA